MCRYLESYNEVFNAEYRKILYIYLGGVISCPVCSTKGNVVIHKLEYKENENEKIQVS